MAKEPVRQFVYPGTAAQAYEFIERVKRTLPGQFAQLKIYYQSGRSVVPRVWKVFFTGSAGRAGIEAYQVSTSKTEFWFFDSYRTYNQPIGQPFADLVDHIIAEHEKLVGPSQNLRT